MTAEIAIMNKDAIALAADSAVTIEQQKGKKIYNTVNKLFMLSKYQPIGIMIYGNATFMGVPSYFIKVKPRHKDLNNKFIAFFISSKIGRLQTNRWASGGIQTNLTIDAIKSIQIPILSRPIQQKISSLIQESLKLYKETKNLINEARQKVENMVQ